jgi:hypothetical protein
MTETVADVRLRELLHRFEEISVVTTTPENFREDVVCKVLGDVDCEIGHIVVVMHLERMLKGAGDRTREPRGPRPRDSSHVQREFRHRGRVRKGAAAAVQVGCGLG